MGKSRFNVKGVPMRYNNLGGAGVQVSQFSLGCMTFSDDPNNLQGYTDKETALQMMLECFEHGINFFDNAEIYGGAGGQSERIMAEAFHEGVKRGYWERKDLVFSTKLFFGSRGLPVPPVNPNVVGLSRKHLYEGLRESLTRMNLEYVDLVFCHRPDPKVRIEEVVRGMNHLIDRGMAFYWGTSEWSAEQIREAQGIAARLGLEPPMFDQCEYSLLERSKVEVDFAALYPGVGLTVWSPLAGGALTGKYRSGGKGRLSSTEQLQKSDSKLLKGLGDQQARRLKVSEGCVDAMAPVARELGCSVAQVALAWAAYHSGVSTVILGARNLEQLRENFGAVRVLDKMTPEMARRISEGSGTAPAPNRIAAQVAGLRGTPTARL
eukprot:Hpha_TRINITY_DN31605_c0_g1::TRINITY_DN31605_c0_g1_i1::g.29136::m.29136